MEVDAAHEKKPSHPRITLREFQGLPFAVVDGSQIFDLPKKLTDSDLDHQALYRGSRNASLVPVGPYLVSSYDENDLQEIQKIVQEQPAVVWWDWPDEGPTTVNSVYSHLRRLGIIQVPSQCFDETSDRGVTSIIFRHSDPRVLSITLPELDQDQWAFFMGDAHKILFHLPGLGLQEAPSLAELVFQPASEAEQC